MCQVQSASRVPASGRFDQLDQVLPLVAGTVSTQSRQKAALRREGAAGRDITTLGVRSDEARDTARPVRQRSAIGRPALRLDQISVCSEISRASSTSIRDNARSTRVWNDQAAVAPHAGSWCADRSTSPWFAASSASRSPRGQVQVPRPNLRGFERTAESPDVASRECDSGTQSPRTSALLA